MIDNNTSKLNSFLPNFNINWVPYKQEGILPPFKMVRAKHNNRTKINIKGSNITKYISTGRELPKIFTYKGYVASDSDALKLRDVFRNYGIEPQCGSETFLDKNHPNYDNEIEKHFIEISFKQANKFISIVQKHREKILNFT